MLFRSDGNEKKWWKREEGADIAEALGENTKTTPTQLKFENTDCVLVDPRMPSDILWLEDENCKCTNDTTAVCDFHNVFEAETIVASPECCGKYDVDEWFFGEMDPRNSATTTLLCPVSITFSRPDHAPQLDVLIASSACLMPHNYSNVLTHIRYLFLFSVFLLLLMQCRDSLCCV